MEFSITSPAFGQNGEIPVRYTCEGENVSPPLNWSGVPTGTESFVLLLEDRDAPDPAAPGMTWVHWLLYNIPGEVAGLPEAVRSATLPKGTREAISEWMRPGYWGPCPPIGRHHYVFRIYALDIILPDMHRPKRNALDHAVAGHILGTAELVGMYRKRRRGRPLPHSSNTGERRILPIQ